MVKRALITTVLGIILITLFAWAYGQFAGSPTPPTIRQRLHAAHTKAWDGAALSTYDTTFVRGSDQVDLQSISYTALNTAAATATATIIVTPGSPTRPKWLTPASFSVRSAGSRVYDPSVNILQSGATYNVTVRDQRLPTTGLGTTCSAAMAPQNALGLFIYSSDGRLVTQLAPPPAPAGHCLDAPTTVPATCAPAAASVTGMRHRDANRRHRIARSHGKARRRLIAANKHALKAEAGRRRQDKAIAAAASCHPPQPRAGRALSAYDKQRDTAAAKAALAGGGYAPPAPAGH